MVKFVLVLCGGDVQVISVIGIQGVIGIGISSSFNMDSWQCMVEVEGGDYVIVGSVLKGCFYLEKEIGCGGMGVVFFVCDECKVEVCDCDLYVVVKVFNDEFCCYFDLLIVLQCELCCLQLLVYDNIVCVYDFDKDCIIVFMMMEYVDGLDFKILICECVYNGMLLVKVWLLIEGMVWVFKCVYGVGVVYLDFKFGNVMVICDGVLKVFDFGIVCVGKYMGDQVGEQIVFDVGMLGVFILVYVSLEMIQGKEFMFSDDIYVFGCVVFELFIGKYLFDKVGVEVVMKEGCKLFLVFGLIKWQYQMLCDVVVFIGDKWLKSVVDFVEGLCEVSLCECIVLYMVFGVIGLVILVVGGWGVCYYLYQCDVNEVIVCFQLFDLQYYVNEDQVVSVLVMFGDDECMWLVIDQGELIQLFLFDCIDNYWNFVCQCYDYVKVQYVFQLCDQFKLYLFKFDFKCGVIEQECNDLFNQFDMCLVQCIDVGVIFIDQLDNVVLIFVIICVIDLISSLLKNVELEFKYDVVVGNVFVVYDVMQVSDELKQVLVVFFELV